MTSLVVLPSAIRRARSSLVGWCQRNLTITIRCSAALAWRSPPRLRRWRTAVPEDASKGHAPHRIATQALRAQPAGVVAGGGRHAPAEAGPTPNRATRPGAALVVS